MRSLRGDSSTQGAGADLNATLTYMTKNMYPGQDRYLWDNRTKELTKELAKVVVQKGPVAANQSMLQQIQELHRENARLKSARAGAPSPAASTAPKTPVHTPPPKNSRPPKSTVTPKAAATPKSLGAHPTPPSYRRPKDRHSTTEAPDNTIRSLEDCWLSRQTEEAGSDQEQEPEPGQEEARDDDATIVPSPDFSPTGVPDQDFADPLETVQTFERTDQALFLDECKVDNYKLATITSSRQGQDA